MSISLFRATHNTVSPCVILREAMPQPPEGQAMTYAVPSMETAYSELRPLFFGAFGSLARQGFAAAPTDTLDLIHDFFTEAWKGITKNYDPKKGPFERYAYVAFVHFVRPRIIGSIHLRNSCVEYEQLLDSTDDRLSIRPDFEFRQDVGKLVAAIDDLPELQLNVLKHYLSFEAPSERALAREFGLSRYKLKSALIAALGSVIVHLDKPHSISERDWNVALAVWRDKRSFEGAAKCNDMTVHQVSSANLRILGFLGQVLSDYQGWGTPHVRSTDMSAKVTVPSAESLFTEALRSPDNPEILEKIQTRREEILEALENADRFLLLDEELNSIDNAWLGKCYEALGVAPLVSKDEGEFYATADAEESLGRAFSEGLMTIGREDIQGFLTLAVLPRIHLEEALELLRTPAAVGAGDYSIPLARVGLTPLSMFYATEAVSYLIERLVNQELVPSEPQILLEEENVLVNRDSHEILTWGLVVDEIQRLSVCEFETAVGVYRWLVQVAQYRPYLFSGFKCSPAKKGQAVALTGTEIRFENLYQRWGFEGIKTGVASNDLRLWADSRTARSS